MNSGAERAAPTQPALVPRNLSVLLIGRIGVSLGLIACAFTAQATTAEPALSIKTKFATVTVEIDSALRQYPGLTGNCLADGRRWAKQMLGRVEKGRRDDPSFFDDGRKWPYTGAYKLRSVVGRYVSVVRFNKSD